MWPVHGPATGRASLAPMPDSRLPPAAAIRPLKEAWVAFVSGG
jgi:hypothetical protein